MDENSGANSTQGATGQVNDFETHPVGTAERLRRLGVIGPMAAELLESQANDIQEGETVNGEWGDDVFSQDVKEACETLAAVAAHLRVLCAPEAPIDPSRELVPIEQLEKSIYSVPPLDDEDFTVQIYPRPAGDE
jgi:hypothetical protein